MSTPSFDAGIKALGPDGLERLVAERDLPPYRARQLTRWLYARGTSTYTEMSDLPGSFREWLAENLALPVPILAQRQVSAIDGTRKYLWRLADGVTVESVGIPAGPRLTVCFSTQAGCAMGCAFCATGQTGFVRNLAPGEMVDQIRLVGEELGTRVSNAVAMGQGEPFANYDATLSALRFANSPDGLGIGARHLTVSTCGLVAGIRRFAKEREQFTLAVSLHSAVQRTRDDLMPGVRNQRLDELRRVLQDYEHETGRRPTLEYALIDRVNDTDEELAALVEFCRNLHSHVNLIPANPIGGRSVRPSTDARVHAFLRALGATGVEASLRVERGADIDAACGQLRQKHGG